MWLRMGVLSARTSRSQKCHMCGHVGGRYNLHAQGVSVKRVVFRVGYKGYSGQGFLYVPIHSPRSDLKFTPIAPESCR